MVFLVLKQSDFGGTNLLLDTLIEFLIEKGNIVLYEDEWLKDNKKIVDYTIIPTSEIAKYFSLRVRGLESEKVLVWAMGHGAFKSAFFNFNVQNSYVFKFFSFFPYFFIKAFKERNAVVFTDLVGAKEDLSLLKKCRVSEKDIVPIAIKKASSEPYKEYSDVEEGVNASWVGRISYDFKVEPIISLIQDLIFIGKECFKIKCFYIVGSGDAADYLKERIGDLKPYFKIVFIEFIEKNDLPVFFRSKKIRISFAMGTAALDSANSYIPTVIVRPSETPYEVMSENYRYIYNSYGYSLGEFKSDKVSEDKLGYLKIDELLKDFYSEWKDISDKSKSYVECFYEERVFSSFIERIKEVKPLRSKSVVYLGFFFFLFKATLKGVVCVFKR